MEQPIKQPIIDVDESGALEKVFDTLEWFVTDKAGITVISAIIVAAAIVTIWRKLPKGVLLFIIIVGMILAGVLKSNIGGQ